MLMTHYRQPINWSAQRIVDCVLELSRWTSSLLQSDAEAAGHLRAVRGIRAQPSAALVAALSDDLNTSEAVSVLRRHHDDAKAGDAQAQDRLLQDAEFLGLLRSQKLWVHMSGVRGRAGLSAKYISEGLQLKTYIANGLGAERRALVDDLKRKGVSVVEGNDGDVELLPIGGESDDTIERLIDARLAARKAKNWAESDRIRDELAAMGIQLKDVKDPATGEIKTEWEVKR